MKRADGTVTYRFKPEIRDVINEFMLAHKDYPYATKSEKNILVKKTGLTESQITMYMSNWRRRHLSLNDRKPFKRSLYYY